MSNITFNISQRRTRLTPQDDGTSIVNIALADWPAIRDQLDAQAARQHGPRCPSGQPCLGGCQGKCRRTTPTPTGYTSR